VNRLFVVLGAAALLMLPAAAQGANGNASYRAVCPSPPAGYGHCHALVVDDSHGNPLATGSPTGLSPATIDHVYGFPGGSAGAGKTIAIVDAYDDPTAASDLNTFSNEFGLPTCTTSNPCFSKVNQTGGTSYPRADSGWGLEISLDIQWAHAIAPGAKILLVEASSNSFANLMAAEDYAKAHAQYVSNSWGSSEFSGETGYDSHFAQSGVSFFVSSGDAGLPAEWPSASPNVISVGGTTLHFDGSGNFTSETGWSAGGGGCSAYEAANGSQSTGQVSCGGKRATPDVSLDADPNSGVAVYDTSYSGQSGWFQVGGTSASSPMWAAAAADNGSVVNAAYVYGNNITFRDITSGNNGAPCLVGFDLCSGRGSWLYSSSPPPPPTLSFGTGSQTLNTGQPSGPIQIDVSAPQTSDVTVNLTSTSATGEFSTSTNGPWSGTLSVTISKSQTASQTFYYEDATAGTPTLTAAASGFTAVTQQETITQTVGSSSMTVSVDVGTISKKGPNYHVPLTVGVTDSSTPPAAIGGASVSLTVYLGACSTGTIAATGSGTTTSAGQASFNFTTRQTGSWCALASVSAPGYTSNSGSANFSTP
jgi:subtilase family serine protease